MSRLTDDGLVVVSYTLLDPGQGKKLFGMLREAYSEMSPRAFCIEGAQHDGGTTFAAGPGLKRLPADVPGVKELTADFADGVAPFELATDDWPFFYMKARTYPYSYLLMIGLLLVVSAVMIQRNLGGRGLFSASRGV